MFGRKRDADRPDVEPQFVRIADAPPRCNTTVRGIVVGMRTQPGDGPVKLEITIEDPSGTAMVVWTGRRSIGGIGLGRRLLVHGVACPTARGAVFMNPAYTLLPAR
jgi:hypothetical protein